MGSFLSGLKKFFNDMNISCVSDCCIRETIIIESEGENEAAEIKPPHKHHHHHHHKHHSTSGG